RRAGSLPSLSRRTLPPGRIRGPGGITMTLKPPPAFVEIIWEDSTRLPLISGDLPEEDGQPLDSDWHRLAMSLLLEVIWYYFRDRKDFFAGGNMFVYFKANRGRAHGCRGPDFFFVWNVERDPLRRYWAVWQESDRYPDVIIELLSPTTAKEDR